LARCRNQSTTQNRSKNMARKPLENVLKVHIRIFGNDWDLSVTKL